MVSVLRSALCGASGSEEQGSVMLAGEVLEVVRTQRQYLDGTGYSCGIGGRESLNLARIVSIRDLFAALIEHRSYKAPKTAKEAYAIHQTMDGKLDATLLRAFSNIVANCSPD